MVKNVNVVCEHLLSRNHVGEGPPLCITKSYIIQIHALHLGGHKQCLSGVERLAIVFQVLNKIVKSSMEKILAISKTPKIHNPKSVSWALLKAN